MTIATLIKELQGWIDEDPANGAMRVILAKDAEGNSFSPIAEKRGISWQSFHEISAWEGEIGDPEGDPEDVERVAVLWPMN